MIIYFSATGNCKHVAKAIAQAADDRAVSMEGLDPRIGLTAGEQLGFVAPTYGWRVPAIVEKFLNDLIFTGAQPAYAFMVSTYGTTPGVAGPFVRRMLANKLDCDLQLFSVKMPDTWTPMFDLSDRERVEEINREADRELEDVRASIVGREASPRMRRQVPSLMIPVANTYYESMRKTSAFSVEDTCVGCGLCASRCPAGAIEMCDGKPVWVAPKCEKCLRCLHYCPKFAIQHGPRTNAHGQYHHK